MRPARTFMALVLGASVVTAACESSDGDANGGADAGLDAALPAGDAGDAAVDAMVASDAADGMVSVQLRFEGKVGNEALVCGQKYANLGTTGITAEPIDFRFFVQDVALITKGGERVPLQLDDGLPYQTKDVALIDFTTGAGACSAGDPTTNMVIRGKVPAGEYTGVSFSNGVPNPLNHGNPSEAPQPLRARSAHWSWIGGYRFVMAGLLPAESASMDAGAHEPQPHAPQLDGGAGDAGEGGVHGGGGHGGGGRGTEVHVGSMGCSGTIVDASSIACQKPNRNRVELTGFDPSNSTIVADLAAVFAGVDLSEGSVCHSSGPRCAAPFQALGVDFESGAASSAQSVFRIE